MLHNLEAAPETCQFGYFDNQLNPALTIQSGDTIRIECISHLAGLVPDLMFDERTRQIWNAVPEAQRGPGAHILTGPVAVSDADPGDVLEVRYLKAQPRLDYGVNVHASWGLCYKPPNDSNARPQTVDLEGSEWITVYRVDRSDGVAWGHLQFPCPNSTSLATVGPTLSVNDSDRRPSSPVRIPLKPHMGIAGVAPAAEGKINSNPPGRFGGNIDNCSFIAGTRMFYPIQVPGGMFIAGDSHFAQGDGEISGTAIEGHLNVTVQLVLHKKLDIRVPILEKEDELIVHGFGDELDDAVYSAASNMIHELQRRWILTQREAYSLLSVAGDCRVSQVVNGVKGAHFNIRKKVLDNVPQQPR